MFIGLDLGLSVIAYILAVFAHFYIVSPEQRAYVVLDDGGLFSPGVYAKFAAQVAGWSDLQFLLTYAYLGIFVAIAQVVTFIATDLYHPRRGTNLLKEVVGITRGVGLTLLIVVGLLFFYRGTSFSRLVIVYYGVGAVLLFSVGHYLFRIFLGRLRSRGYNTRNVLILGTGKIAARFYEILKRHAIFGYRVMGFVGPKAKVPGPIKPLIKGNVRDLKRIARSLDPDLIVYAMPQDLKLLEDVIEFCDTEGIDCRIVPDLTELITSRARVEDMDGMPLLTIRDVPLKNGYNAAVKRFFDVCVSALALLGTFPIYVILPILIKLDSPGPVFFGQERVGLDRKLFKLYKFRTMKVQTQGASDTTWGSKQDSRVTALGRFLRKTSLDELPQFWNVLKGDMSMVGPRPERPHFVEEFKEKYAGVHYMRRHSVKSGITGWAQIQGLRGDTSIAERAEADIYYIENWSFWLDVLIILKTPGALVKSPGE